MGKRKRVAPVPSAAWHYGVRLDDGLMLGKGGESVVPERMDTFLSAETARRRAQMHQGEAVRVRWNAAENAHEVRPLGPDAATVLASATGLILSRAGNAGLAIALRTYLEANDLGSAKLLAELQEVADA